MMPQASFARLRRPRPSLLHFEIDGVDLCIVNAIRRAALGEVPTMAFAHDPSNPDAANMGVFIKSNTSAHNNEFLAQRISLVPLHLGEDELEKTLLNPTRLRFSIKVKNGDVGGSGAVRIVTSKDIDVSDGITGLSVAQEVRDAMFPPDAVSGDHVLLVRLRPTATGDSAAGEEFTAELVASPGHGAMHARWSPVCQCHLSNRPDAAKVALALETHLAIRKADGHDDSGDAPGVLRQFMTLQAQRQFVVDKWGDACAFDFVVESTCGMRPEYIVFKALLVLSRRVAALAKQVAVLTLSADPTTVTASKSPVSIDVCENADDTYVISVKGEGHTLGNLVQGLIYNRFVRDHPPPPAPASALPYIGYHEPHPLDKRIVFKLSVSAKTDVVKLFSDALTDTVVAHLDAVNRAWIVASGLDTVRPPIQEVAAWLKAHPMSS